VRFLDDGRIELDTNIVERSIRPIVLNRKNALFAGHDQGAENWAAIASLERDPKSLCRWARTIGSSGLGTSANKWSPDHAVMTGASKDQRRKSRKRRWP
jgi:hypothetical protein